jgi:hypothetical protein
VSERSPVRRPPSAIALGAWLALPLVVAKAVHWGQPGEYGWGAWLRDVAVSSHQDVAFCAAFALGAAGVLLLVRRWPRVERWVGAALVAAGAVSVLYAVVSVQVFAFLRSPLTYALLYLAGDPASMRSSIGSFLSPSLVAACVLMPAAYVTLIRRTPRAAGVRGTAAGAAFLAVAAGWTLWGAAAAGGRWSDRSDVLIAKSPHVEILASTAAVVRGEQVPVIARPRSRTCWWWCWSRPARATWACTAAATPRRRTCRRRRRTPSCTTARTRTSASRRTPWWR